MTAEVAHEFIDVIDMQPEPGAYVDVRDLRPVEACGETVQAYTWEHAYRLVINRRWQSRCECCNQHIRYAHVTQSADGAFHCFGRTCLDVKTLGREGARRVALAERIEKKKSGAWCAVFDVPPRYWDIPREKRPPFGRLWKAPARSRRDRPTWKLCVWGDTFAECQANCLDLERTVGVQLC